MLSIAQFYALANVTLKFWAFGLAYTIVRFRHIGIDIGTGRKAIDVPALLGGKVVRVVRTSTMGMVVVIQVGSRYFAYCHLADRDLPDVGDVIKQGGRVGRLAWSTDPKSRDYAGTAWKGIHLHLVVTNQPNGAFQYPRAAGVEFYDPAPIIRDVLAPKPNPKPAGVKKPNPPKITYYGKQVTTTAVNLRSEPNTKSKILAVVPAATVVANGAAVNGWHPVKYGTKHGWIRGDYIVVRDKTVTAAKGLNLRKTPSTRGTIVTGLKKGTKVTVLAVQGTKDNARWWKVRAGARTGWVDSRFLG